MEEKNLVPQRNVTAIRKVRAGSSGDYVPHLTFDMVQRLTDAAKQEARKGKGDRDKAEQSQARLWIVNPRGIVYMADQEPPLATPESETQPEASYETKTAEVPDASQA